jgi:sulfite reductase alpha subunit-like flavoprotein
MRIAVLYGTETGNAEMLAEDIGAHLSDHDPRAANLSDTAPGDLEPETLCLVVCSTYGDGDLPASAKPFAERMHAAAPDLSGAEFRGIARLDRACFARAAALAARPLRGRDGPDRQPVRAVFWLHLYLKPPGPSATGT